MDLNKAYSKCVCVRERETKTAEANAVPFLTRMVCKSDMPSFTHMLKTFHKPN